MTFTTHEQGGYTYVRLEGLLNGGEVCTRFHAMVYKALQQDSRVFIFNFEQCEWANATGLGLLLASRNAITQAGGRIVLCETSAIDSTLAITLLDQVFEIYETEAEACEAVGAPLPEFGSAKC